MKADPAVPIIANANSNLQRRTRFPWQRRLDHSLRYWEIIADNLSKAGWSWGCVSAVDSCGRTIFIADAHRDDGKRFVVRADGKLTALLELDSAVQRSKTEYGTARRCRTPPDRPRSYRPQARFLGNSSSLNRSESGAG